MDEVRRKGVYQSMLAADVGTLTAETVPWLDGEMDQLEAVGMCHLSSV